MLAILRDEIVKLPPHVGLFVTSRPTRVIEHFLSGSDNITTHIIDVNSIENKEDILAYADAQLGYDTVIQSQMGTPCPDEALNRDLKIMADGLFVWMST